MLRFIVPVILIGISLVGFFTFASPMLKDIGDLQQQASSYSEALTNSKALENERDKLTTKYNSISGEDLAKIEKMLPENVDNIRLILEIEKIAQPYGMNLRDVKYDTISRDSDATEGIVQSEEFGGASREEYGTWSLEFSTQATYNNFLNFLKDLEKNLRIVDISSISFSSNTASVGTGSSSLPSDFYKYSFTVKTYWLKN